MRNEKQGGNSGLRSGDNRCFWPRGNGKFVKEEIGSGRSSYQEPLLSAAIQKDPGAKSSGYDTKCQQQIKMGEPQQFLLIMVKNKIAVQMNSGSGSSSGLGEFWNDELAK